MFNGHFVGMDEEGEGTEVFVEVDSGDRGRESEHVKRVEEERGEDAINGRDTIGETLFGKEGFDGESGIDSSRGGSG
jgi:hypothetical protein